MGYAIVRSSNMTCAFCKSPQVCTWMPEAACQALSSLKAVLSLCGTVQSSLLANLHTMGDACSALRPHQRCAAAACDDDTHRKRSLIKWQREADVPHQAVTPHRSKIRMRSGLLSAMAICTT